MQIWGLFADSMEEASTEKLCLVRSMLGRSNFFYEEHWFECIFWALWWSLEAWCIVVNEKKNKCSCTIAGSCMSAKSWAPVEIVLSEILVRKSARKLRLNVLKIVRALLKGDVMAQLAKATGWHQAANAVVPGSNPASLTVSWTGPGIVTVYQKQVSGWEASLSEQKKKRLRELGRKAEEKTMKDWMGSPLF
jgi:hypothetical protein